MKVIFEILLMVCGGRASMCVGIFMPVGMCMCTCVCLCVCAHMCICVFRSKSGCLSGVCSGLPFSWVRKMIQENLFPSSHCVLRASWSTSFQASLQSQPPISLWAHWDFICMLPHQNFYINSRILTSVIKLAYQVYSPTKQALQLLWFICLFFKFYFIWY